MKRNFMVRAAKCIIERNVLWKTALSTFWVLVCFQKLVAHCREKLVTTKDIGELIVRTVDKLA